MRSSTSRKFIFAAAMLPLLLGSAPSALAQNQPLIVVPGQPAPVPVPPQPINPQPGSAQPKVDTFSDKVTRCLHYGGSIGLPPGQRDAYVRGCANN
jgi:hypothetical protein